MMVVDGSNCLQERKKRPLTPTSATFPLVHTHSHSGDLPAVFDARLFEGRVVLITGTAASVGVATAHMLASVGTQLVLSDHASDGLQDPTQSLGGSTQWPIARSFGWRAQSAGY